MEIEGLSEAEVLAAMKRINAYIRTFSRRPDYSGETRWQGEIKFFMRVLVRVPLVRKDVTDYYPVFTRGVSKMIEQLRKNTATNHDEDWYDYRRKYSNIHICRVVHDHISRNMDTHPPKLAKTMAGIIGDIQDKLILEMRQEKIEFFQAYRLRNRRKEKIQELITLFFEQGFCRV